MTHTTLAVSMETKEILQELGSKGESYETIIRRLIKEAGMKKLNEHWNKILEEDTFIPLDEL